MIAPDTSPAAAWKKRFTAPYFFTFNAQANPARGLAVSDVSGILQLYAWDVESGAQRQITDEPAGVMLGGISPDGAYIYYHQDTKGDELGKWVRVPFDGDTATPREDIAPGLPPYNSFSLSQSVNGAVVGFVTATPVGFRVYTMAADAIPGTPELLYQTNAFTYGPILSYDARYAVIGTTEHSPTRDFCAMAFELNNPAPVVKILQDTDGSLQPLAFAPIAGDSRILCSTDVSGEERPCIWDVATGDRVDIPLPQMHGSITPQAWFPDGRRILLSQLEQAVHRLYVYDLTASTLTALDHPGGTYTGSYIRQDGDILTHWQDATHPAYAVTLDATTGTIKQVLLGTQSAPPGRAWQSVNFKSSGGVTVQAWLCRPEGDGPFPMILHTHGGPTSVMTETYHAEAQAWVDHGFAWMSVNYRGSITFGRAFEHAILGMLGHREVDDMVAARDWAVQNGIAQAEKIYPTGRSYGGYLTLQALGTRPELWAGGMAIVAIADWTLMYEDMAESLRGYHRSLWGGTPQELPEVHRSGSPITYVDDVSAPVVVLQGRNDSRCPARQMQAYEDAMREAGKTIAVHWFDAGHGVLEQAQKIHHMELLLHWMYNQHMPDQSPASAYDESYDEGTR